MSGVSLPFVFLLTGALSFWAFAAFSGGRYRKFTTRKDTSRFRR